MTVIYENGVFRPLGTVRLPEHTRVEVELPDVPSESTVEAEKGHLLAEVRALHGSLSPPADANDTDLITAGRMEKYGPL
ncbi:MAG TPA: antitoxin family protein [Verrucomicrobiales bacterium]|jgi:predicted DNA-binding antitoxin AbrB/MazE fold protein|nr:antitoxin family protein [Verrucomicrobiales bacterium]